MKQDMYPKITAYIIENQKGRNFKCHVCVKKVRIAEACKTGDAMAMYEMAYMMRSQCTPEEISR